MFRCAKKELSAETLSRGEKGFTWQILAIESSKELEKFGSPQLLHSHTQEEFARAS